MYQTHPMVSIYNTAAKGNLGWAWYNYTQYLKSGIKNPRAKLLSVAEGEMDLKYNAFNTKKVLEQNGRHIDAEIFSKGYRSLFKQIFEQKEKTHPYIKKAYKQLEEQFKKIYPNKKTQSFSRFIIFKQKHPIIGKLRFLARLF